VADSSKTCGGEDRIQIYDLMSKYLSHNLLVLIKCTYYTYYKNFDIHFIEVVHTINSNETIDLVDEFNTLNLESIWSHDVYIAQEPVCRKIQNK